MSIISAQTSQDPLALITGKEAARLLGCCERTLWKMREAGKISCVKIGVAVRFTREEIARFIESQSTPLIDTTPEN